MERELITIGEAMRIVLDRLPAIEERFEDARGIVDLRNVLVHGYRRLDSTTIWAIVNAEVPVLLNQARELLAESG